jgi:hypothetical protein
MPVIPAATAPTFTMPGLAVTAWRRPGPHAPEREVLALVTDGPAGRSHGAAARRVASMAPQGRPGGSPIIARSTAPSHPSS